MYSAFHMHLVQEIFRKLSPEEWSRYIPLQKAADAYDGFLVRELAKEEDIFHEARLIGKILGRYCLGVSDAWYALRIEELIKQGVLVVVERYSYAGGNQALFFKVNTWGEEAFLDKLQEML